jgi:hypothetical protein
MKRMQAGTGDIVFVAANPTNHTAATTTDYCNLCSNGRIRNVQLGLGEEGNDFCF